MPNTIVSRQLLQVRRRNFVGRSGLLLSGTAIALLSGRSALARDQGAAGSKNLEGDVGVLNAALGSEYEAIAAYQLGAESGLLEKPVLALAQTFQGHHKAHADLLARTVEQFGGKPVAARPNYTFPTDSLKQQADVLRFAAGLEQGAVAAYLEAVPVFDNRELARAAASILGDEAMHWAVLRHALGEDPVPAAFV